MRLVPFALALPVVLAAACAQEPVRPLSSSIDVGAAVAGSTLRGVAANPAAPDLFDLVIDGQGIVTINRDGDVVTRRAPGEHGLWDVPYKDVADVGDDVFVLLADQEGYLYDARSERQTVHFCVEPGFEPGEPTEPLLEQKNDAVAASGNLIVAAPRFYQDGVLVESDLRTYRAGDGTEIASVDMMSLQLELRGLALAGDEIFGVQGDQLHRFSVAGEHLGVEVLEDLDSASGVAARGDELIVADETASTLRIYQR